MARKYDLRTLAVLASEAGAVPLIVIGLASSSFVIPGCRWIPVVIGVYTVVSIILTVALTPLTDRWFAVLSFGGMLGIVGCAYSITDAGSAHAILVLLAAIPALAAMESPPRVVGSFVVVAGLLASSVVIVRATSTTALIVAGGAAWMAIIVPTFLVLTLRKSLTRLVDEHQRLSATDPLTGALNRRGLLSDFEVTCGAVAAGATRVGFLVADIDLFKRVNDEHGHSAGDAILVETTQILKRASPDQALIARTGGEEFLIVTPIDDEMTLAQLGERIRHDIAGETDVTVSVGGACAELAVAQEGVPTGQVLDTLFGSADECLYRAKQLGRNRIETKMIDGIRWRPTLAAHPSTAPDLGLSRNLWGSWSYDRPRETPADTGRPPITSAHREHSGFVLLDPVADATLVAEHLARGYELIDSWQYAGPELQQLDALQSCGPEPSPPVLDVTDPDVLTRHSRLAVYPWRGTVVRVPDSSTFYRLRTARNRFLLTGAEQTAWSTATVAVAGLSSGTAAMAACALTGARHFHLADPDKLAVTNLNRMSGSICDITQTKIDLAVRQLLESDPYTRITAFPFGYRPGTADSFLGIDDQPVAVVIDEIDDVAMKIDLRQRARAAGIPVISTTDIGANLVLDVERFDLDRTYPLFHGRAEDFDAGDPTDPAQRLRMAAQIVGDVLTPRMAYSASQIGRSISSWPQLGATAMMAGSFAATAARMIVCGQPIASGRYHLEFDHILLGASARGTDGWNELTEEEMIAVVSSIAGPGSANPRTS